MTIDINAARHKAADLTTAHTACDKDGACLRCAARGIELAGLVSLLCGEAEQWRATFGEDALLMSTDGDPLDDAEEIRVGEIRRVLGEAREGVPS